ncbi:MAG: hypothetical protein R3D32_03410 [Nitratireductor sp.]
MRISMANVVASTTVSWASASPNNHFDGSLNIRPNSLSRYPMWLRVTFRCVGIGCMPSDPRSRSIQSPHCHQLLHARYEPVAFAIAENELPLKPENITVAFAAKLHGYSNILA